MEHYHENKENSASSEKAKPKLILRIKMKSSQNKTDEEKMRKLLDKTDKLLHTRCVEMRVKFIWPKCVSQRSNDEDPVKQEERREKVKRMLKVKKLLANCALKSKNSGRPQLVLKCKMPN